jgi:hypothetical protein
VLNCIGAKVKYKRKPKGGARVTCDNKKNSRKIYVMTRETAPRLLDSSAVAAVGLRGFRVDPNRVRVIHISEERQVSAKDIGVSMNASYNCSSASCCNAFLATVWKACSTLMASFAEVSK